MVQENIWKDEFVEKNYERLQNGSSMGGDGLLSILKNIFGRRMR